MYFEVSEEHPHRFALFSKPEHLGKRGYLSIDELIKDLLQIAEMVRKKGDAASTSAQQ